MRLFNIKSLEGPHAELDNVKITVSITIWSEKRKIFLYNYHQ